MADTDPIALCLFRLYRYRRLLQLNAPLPILAQSKKLLNKSRESLGGDLSEVERLYPEYAAERSEANQVDLRWETRCHECVHWNGPPWEWQDDCLDIQEVKWCKRFKIDETSRPEECPKFSEKGDLS